VKKKVQDRFSGGDKIYMQLQGKVTSQLFKKIRKSFHSFASGLSLLILFAVNGIRWQNP